MAAASTTTARPGSAAPLLTNVTFAGNLATDAGGGMYNYAFGGGASSPVLTNVTFAGNLAAFGGGGAMHNNAGGGTSSPQLVNVILWGDSSPDGTEIAGGTPLIAYSNIDQEGFAGTNHNIRANPQFVAAISASSAPTSTGNYRLQPGSPAVDAGTNTGCPANDRDGTVRPLDGSGDGTAICDMGAYEVQLLFVDKDAAGANNGTSWTDAYQTLQQALDWTNAHHPTIFEIWVAEGVYYPDLRTNQDSNLQTESFRISFNNVQIYGGFAATETLRSQRVPAVHPTILSGDIDNEGSGSDTNSDGNSIAETSTDIQGSNAYHVLYLDGQTNVPLTTTTVLDGFIITAGNADTDGGGLYCAAIGAGTGCSPTIAHVTFSGNKASFAGGGMCNTGFYGGVSSPVLTKVTFSGNKAGSTGGGMYNHSDSSGVSSPVLANVTFSGNQANTGGGMVDYSYAGTSSPLLINVTFSGNLAAGAGGGMVNFVQSDGVSSPQLVNVILWGDSAPDSAEIANNGGTPTISYSDINQDGITGTGNFREDPLLSGPADHGGGTRTFALLPGSPAIDTGNGVACATAPVNNLDQRGVSRPQGGGCDIGAFESRGSTLMTAGGSPQETTIRSPFALPLAVLAGSADSEPLGPGGVITLTPPAEGPGLTVTAPFTVATDATGLTAGTVVTANGVAGSFNVTATAAGAAIPTVFSLVNTKIEPTVTLAIIPNPAPYGAALTLTATVTTTLGAVLDPITGSVVFTDTTNTINLSSALTAGSAVVGANPLAAGTYTVTASYGGDSGHTTATATAVVQVLPPPIAPHARADVAAVLQDTPLLLDVLANDVAGTSPQMAVYTVTQPLMGGITAIEQNQVRFIPAAGFTGLVTFTYTVRDGNELESSAAVAVQVTARESTNGEPQVVAVPDPSRSGGGTVTVPAGTTEIEVPAGAITPTENPLSTYDLVYQEVNAPAPPPAGTTFTFGGRAFTLQLFVNAQLQTPYTFNVPIFVTLSYDPAIVIDTSKLALYYYDESRQEWATDGIVILSVDTQAHTFRASIAHLTEFAAGIRVPTGSDPSLEPQLLPQLYLPEIQP